MIAYELPVAMLLAVLNTSLSAQPQPSGKNKAGAKIASSKLQIFFLQMSGTAQGKPQSRPARQAVIVNLTSALCNHLR